MQRNSEKVNVLTAACTVVKQLADTSIAGKYHYMCYSGYVGVCSIGGVVIIVCTCTLKALFMHTLHTYTYTHILTHNQTTSIVRTG